MTDHRDFRTGPDNPKEIDPAETLDADPLAQNRDQEYARILVTNLLVEPASIDRARSDAANDPSRSFLDILVERGEISAKLRSGIDQIAAEIRSRRLPSKEPPADTLPIANADTAREPHETMGLPEHESDSVSAPRRRIGDYEIDSIIAEGGMGVVYKARQLSLDRVVALKMIRNGGFINDNEVRRFHTEAQAAGKLDHPGIVAVYEVGESGGHHFYAMAFVDGQSLDDRVKQDGPLAPGHAASIMRDSARAVQHAHDADVIHRDIKPHNILLDREGNPRVADFGLAKLQNTDSELTATGQVVGTPAYMPPEQAAGATDKVGVPAVSQFVDRCRDRGITPDELVQCFELVDQRRGPLDGDRQKSDDSVMYALLLALGEFSFDELSEANAGLIQRLNAIYEKDPSSGVHSATGRLLRQWGGDEHVARVDQTATPYDESGHREWFVRGFEDLPGNRRDNSGKFFLTFIVFPAGEFTMGTRKNEPKRESIENLHPVNLTRPIAVCDRELTWEQFNRFDGAGHQRAWKMQFSKQLTTREPVFGVSWFEAVDFCRWLTLRAGLSESEQCYASDPVASDRDPRPGWVELPDSTPWALDLSRPGFRLLTEAEWEYVARSGTRTAYSFGNDEDVLGRYAWNLQNSDDWSHPVAERRSNPRGLFDIHGNVFEWCHDWLDLEFIREADPRGARTGTDRVFRGGSWADPAKYSRSSARSGIVPSSRSSRVGFRLAFSLPGQKGDAGVAAPARE